MEITVLDVNDHVPKFDNESYFAYMEEGKMYDNVVQVHATDEDGSSTFKDVCNYELLSHNELFEITPGGVLRNKKPVDYNVHRNFILEVSRSDASILVFAIGDAFILLLILMPLLYPGNCSFSFICVNFGSKCFAHIYL